MEHPQDSGILTHIEDDGHPVYWILTFHHMEEKFYCSIQPTIGHLLKFEYVLSPTSTYYPIRRYWDYGRPI